MTSTRRAWWLPIATALSGALLGTGITAGALAQGPAAASPVNGTPAPGIGFAIPSNVVRDIAGQIVAAGHVTDSRRAALGAQIATIDGTAGYPSGAGIVAVTPGGPADRAGLRAGDVIRSAGPRPTPSAEALSQALAAMRPGQTITVAIICGRQPLTVPVTLGQLPGS